MRGRGKKLLTTDDRILWSKVARSTRPLPGRMEEIEALEHALAEEQEQPERKAPLVTKAAPSLKSGASARTFEDMTYQAPPQKKPGGPHQPLERPVKRKLARGRLELQARIDLHGLFQDEAHALLHSFILRAHERGLRHVLVITGKGASMGSEGALKRAVPMWFSKPEFRHLISSWETSAPNHGGEGALYVRLSRRRGEPE